MKAAPTAAFALVLSLAACGSSSEFAAICRSPGEGVSATKTTPAHIFGLSVTTGFEPEHTQSQVKAQHIKHGGDTLIAGRLRTVDLNKPGEPRHLELHVCDAKTGRTLTDLHPAMTVTDSTAATAPIRIPLATLIGTGEPADDLHYGNHVVMRSGDSYRVTVRLGRDRVVLPIQL
jgi:hypothetical protein